MTRPADWWAAAGTRHAFPVGSMPFRSFCGHVHWSAALGRDEDAATCAECAEIARGPEPEPAMRAGTGAMSPAVRRRVYARRRWRGTRSG